MTQAVQLTDPLVFHGEGPVWSASWGGLRWMDMLAGDVMSLRLDGSVERIHVGTVAAIVRPRRQGGAVVALEYGVAVTDGPLTELRPLAGLITDPAIRLNEGGCDPDGNFYCGSMGYGGPEGAGALYRITADGAVSTVLDSVTISNGFDFSPDRSTAYYVDTRTHRIDIFDYSAETGLTNRRPWVRVPLEAGGPDGLTVDAQGYVWVALYGGSAVRRYSPAGALEEVVELPVTQVTACTFGGADLSALYITTSRDGVPPGEQPQAGALFTVDTGVTGLEVLPYAG